MTPSQLAVWQKWRGIKNNITKLENQALELMRHPDATIEQLQASHEMLLDVQQRVAEVQPRLRKAGIII